MPRKRGNREGSIRRRADGRWEGRIMLGYRQDGRPYRKTVYGRTRQEVAEKLGRLAGASGIVADPQQLTIGQYLEQWLEHHCKFGGREGQGLRWGTQQNYRQAINSVIIPRLGNIRLARLSATHLRALYMQMAEEGFSQDRIAYIHMLLAAALRAAVIEGLLDINPCDRLADRPKRNKPKDICLTREEVLRLLAAAATDHIPNVRALYLPILLGCTTGLRASEMAGLRWCDVDLEAQVIHARHQYRRGPDGWGLQPLKNENSVRTVPLPPDVVDFLRQYRRSQKVTNIEGFVCVRASGRPWHAEDVDNYFAILRKKVGLAAGVTYHTLRHSYTTWLAEAGVNPRAMAALLGHAQIQTTLRVYQSVTKVMTDRAREVLQGLVSVPVGVRLGSHPGTNTPEEASPGHS